MLCPQDGEHALHFREHLQSDERALQKCSGDRPVCRLCTTYHRQCVYKPHEPSKSKDPRKGRRTVKSESVPAAKPSSKPSVEVYTNWLDGGHQVGESAGAVYGSQVVIADEIMKEEVLRLRARVGG